MSVYLIAEIEVLEPSTYRQYTEAARPLIERWGGKYHVRGGAIKPLSGDWTPERVVMIEFPTIEAYRNCFDSAAYRRIAPLREKSTRSRSILVENGTDAPSLQRRAS